MKILAQPSSGFHIVQVDAVGEVDAWRASFAGAYQTIWADPPYSERWFPDEAEGVLLRNLRIPDNQTLLTVRDGVAGFALGSPVQAFPVVVRDIRGLLPIEHTFYFSDLAVLERYRGQGIGRKMLDLRFAMLNRNKYHTVILRLSAQRDRVYEMYRRIGFEDTGVYTEVAFRREDGSTRTDRRIYLSLTF